MNSNQLILEIFHAGMQSVEGQTLCERSLKVQDGVVEVNGRLYDLNTIDRVIVIGFGKASASMARGLENVLKDQINGGLIITKYGHGKDCGRIEIIEAGHPVPDEQGRQATRKMMEWIKGLTLTPNDLVICLISGGGSALLVDLPDEVSLARYAQLNEWMLNSGMNIREINLIRKYLGYLKGGKLLSYLYPAEVLGLIISDIVGDPLEDIASGPSVEQTLDSKQAEVWLSASRFSFKKGIGNEKRPKAPANNFILANNRLFLEQAAQYAENLGYDSEIIDSEFCGSVERWEQKIMAEINEAEESGKKMCLLFGGEPLIEVKGLGKGGRNQHLALMLTIRLQGRKRIRVICAGTDGTDGPTQAAGAIINGYTYLTLYKMGRKAEDYVKKFDSYHFFSGTDYHLITGPTGTNVMDVVVVLIST